MANGKILRVTIVLDFTDLNIVLGCVRILIVSWLVEVITC